MKSIKKILLLVSISLMNIFFLGIVYGNEEKLSSMGDNVEFVDMLKMNLARFQMIKFNMENTLKKATPIMEVVKESAELKEFTSVLENLIGDGIILKVKNDKIIRILESMIETGIDYIDTDVMEDFNKEKEIIVKIFKKFDKDYEKLMTGILMKMGLKMDDIKEL